MSSTDATATSTPDSSPSTTASSSWKSYFTNTEWVLFGALIVVGLILRWTLLDMRPYHHDESLHGMYGRYFYDFPDNNYYKYDPMLHGPMLYNCMRFVYAIFGDSLWAGRTPVCVMGSLFILMPFVFRRFFSKNAVLILTAYVALSPTLVYWSRFLREDFWVVSGMLMCLYGFLVASSKTKPFWVFTGLSIQWCTKENVFVTLAIVVGYLVFEPAFRWAANNFFGVTEKDTDPKPLAQRMATYVARHPWHTAWGSVAGILLYSWFYSAGFRYPEGLIKGLGKAGYDYWSAHHGMERIEGPFNFHIYVLGWYELPFMIAFITHLALFYRRTRSEFQFAAAFLVGLLLVCVGMYWSRDLKQSSWSVFKLKDLFDMAGLFVLLFHAPIVTIHHLLKRQYGLAACAYFFTATFFAYSYLGEKVPWLSMYPFIFGLPYLTLFFEDYFRRHPVDFKNFSVRTFALYVGCAFMVFGFWFVLEEVLLQQVRGLANAESVWGSALYANVDFLAFGAILVVFALLDTVEQYLGTMNVGLTIIVIALLFTLRSSIQTNFQYAGKETEYISQVHTTYEVAEIAKKIIAEVIYEPNMYRPKVFVTGEGTWPLTWYFRHLRDEYRFTATDTEKYTFTYLFQDWKDQPPAGYYPEGYYARRVNLRGWWVPDFKQMTLKKYLRFAFNHYPWGPSGFSYTTVLEAVDTQRFKPLQPKAP